MKDIMLRIIGNRLTGLGSLPDEDAVEFLTKGRFVQKGDALYLIYDETDLSGQEGWTTSMKISDGKVRIKRYGEGSGIGSAIEFEQGKKWDGFFETPFGSIPLEVLTNVVDNRIDPETVTGSVELDCSVSLRGLSESRNRLRIEIMQ
ncbi:MAG: DUF1934 domain-containing protein [Clostridiales bacterium]|nr:DUF1934 domain-containing protein [Clostridiales bacterium]